MSSKNPKKRKDLKGFEDVLDLMPVKKRLRKKNINPRLTDNFSLLDFLQNEFQRLEKLDTFFTQQMQTMEKYNQFDSLITKQTNSNSEFQKQVLEKASQLDSDLFHNLCHLFNKAYKKTESTKN